MLWGPGEKNPRLPDSGAERQGKGLDVVSTAILHLKKSPEVEEMYQEEWEYIGFATPQILDKELHTLEGILKGIAIDGKINTDEISSLLG